MSVSLVVFLLGLFGVPIVLLAVGHRLRRRGQRVRHAFVGAFVGHCVAGVLAVAFGLIPAEAWSPEDTRRGFVGLWSLLVLPVVGAAVGATSRQLRLAAIAVFGVGLTAAVDPDWFGPRQPAATLVGVIGHWSAIDDGGPTLTVDGARWNGATTRAQLESAMKPFFPTVGDLLVANGTAPGAFPLAVWTGMTNFTEGTIRMQFKMLGGESDQNAGIVIGLQPSGEYHYVRYNTKDGDMAAWRFANGDRVRIVHGAKHEQLALNVWHELTVRVSGSRVTGMVNDSVTVEHVLDKPLSGQVGVWVKRDAITSFRNFRVSPR
jgi:hypothetical protein